MSSRTRGIVDENSFKQVKELQNMGATYTKAAGFVGLSKATTNRMYKNDTFEAYRKFVRSISNNKPKETPEVATNYSSFKVPDMSEIFKANEIQQLTDAINRLTTAIEESNTKKKGLW
jgi:DNA-binding MurR/RpiR family transcriptional regulator